MVSEKASQKHKLEEKDKSTKDDVKLSSLYNLR